MKNQAPWLGKVFDEPRAGFVAEHGSQWHPVVKPPVPDAPVPSSLDKIIDEERLGFADALRADNARSAAAVTKLRSRGRKPQNA